MFTSSSSLGPTPLVCDAESRRVADGNTRLWHLAHIVIHRGLVHAMVARICRELGDKGGAD
jgi:hypothetical protein